MTEKDKRNVTAIEMHIEHIADEIKTLRKAGYYSITLGVGIFSGGYAGTHAREIS